MKGSTMFKWQWQCQRSAQCRQRKLFINYNCNLCCLKLYSNLYVVLENLRLRVEFIPSHLRLWEALKNCWNMTMPLLQYSMHGMWKVGIGHRQGGRTPAVYCTALHCTALHDAERTVVHCLTVVSNFEGSSLPYYMWFICLFAFIDPN